MEVLQDSELAQAILAIFEQQGQPRCAVAFWGMDMAARARECGAEVVLDISMGGTSKNALLAFGLVPDKLPMDLPVTVLDGLHAKVFLSESSAVITSANASRNALGTEDRLPALKEAGVRFDRQKDPEAYAAIEKIYAGYLAASRPVEREDFDRAPSAVLNAAARDNHSDDQDAATSILEALTDNPNTFARVSFIFADHPIDKENLDDAEKAYYEDVGKNGRSGSRSHICSIDDEEQTDERLRAASLIIMFWLGSRPGIWAFHDIHRVEHDGGVVSYFGRRHWGVVSRALGLKHTKSQHSWDHDRTAAEYLANSDGDVEGERFVALHADETLERVEVMGR